MCTTDDANPQGEPKLEIGKASRWYVWHDKAGWHIRTTTGGNLREFHGMICIVEGNITQFEPVKSEGKKQDWWKMADERRVVRMNLQTAGKLDGFDFKVSDKAKEIVFDLKISGSDKADQVLIGKNAVNPKSGTFVVPAHPGKK